MLVEITLDVKAGAVVTPQYNYSGVVSFDVKGAGQVVASAYNRAQAMLNINANGSFSVNALRVVPVTAAIRSRGKLRLWNDERVVKIKGKLNTAIQLKGALQ